MVSAPSAAELLGDFVDTLLADADETVRYRDDDLAVPADPNEIDAHAMRRAVAGLEALRTDDPERLGDWFGRFMTLYRSVGDSLMPDPPRSRIEIEFDLQQGALLQRHPWTRVAWRRSAESVAAGQPPLAKLYVAGQTHAMPVADARILAAAGTLDVDTYAALSPQSQALVLDLLAEGHYRLENEGEDTGEEFDDEH